jgi:hypothetical protein
MAIDPPVDTERGRGTAKGRGTADKSRLEDRSASAHGGQTDPRKNGGVRGKTKPPQGLRREEGDKAGSGLGGGGTSSRSRSPGRSSRESAHGTQ